MAILLKCKGNEMNMNTNFLWAVFWICVAFIAVSAYYITGNIRIEKNKTITDPIQRCFAEATGPVMAQQCLELARIIQGNK